MLLISQIFSYRAQFAVFVEEMLARYVILTRTFGFDVTSAGEGGLRMAWGSTQEAAALFSVIHLFPNSQLEEVGLCWVDAKSQIPLSWGFRAGDLPPLGASPDGLIRHKPTSSPLQPGPVAAAQPMSDDLMQQGTVAPHNPPRFTDQKSQSDPDENNAHMPPASAAQHDASWSAAPQVAVPQRTEFVQKEVSQPTQVHDPALAEFEALLSKLELSSQHLHSKAAQTDTGLTSTNIHEQASTAPQQAALLSAAAAPSLSASAIPFSPTPQSQRSVTSTASMPASAASAASAEDIQSGMTSSHASPAQEEEHQHEWLEAVEIKNVCPFREARNVSSNGKARRLYRLSDPGPYSRVQYLLLFPALTTQECYCGFRLSCSDKCLLPALSLVIHDDAVWQQFQT